MNKNFMYGLGAVKYKDFVVGYIEKGSFDLGGQKPEAAKIEAEQVPGAPVLIIPQSNGSIAPTFNVIKMDYKNLHALLGGSLHYKKEDSEKNTPVGWTAPQAAGVIHTDFEKGFIAAQIVSYPDLVELGSEAAAKAAGKLRTEGKTYIMQPDDVVEFRFNV